MFNDKAGKENVQLIFSFSLTKEQSLFYLYLCVIGLENVPRPKLRLGILENWKEFGKKGWDIE